MYTKVKDTQSIINILDMAKKHYIKGMLFCLVRYQYVRVKKDFFYSVCVFCLLCPDTLQIKVLTCPYLGLFFLLCGFVWLE